MKKLWNVINSMKIERFLKSTLYVTALIIINLVAGGAVWWLLGRIVLPGIDWLICFMGYPALFVGYFGGRYYLIRHNFY